MSLVFTLTAGVMIGVGYSDYKITQRKAQQNLSAAKEEVPKWTDVGILWFTLVLTAATLVQVVLWMKSNKTAEDANAKADTNIELTRQSIQQLVQANIIALDNSKGDLNHEASTANAQEGRIYWVFRNKGNGVIYVTHSMLQVAKMKGGKAEFGKEIRAVAHTPPMLIEKEGIYSSGGIEGYDKTMKDLNNYVELGPNDDGGIEPIIIRLRIHYHLHIRGVRQVMEHQWLWIPLGHQDLITLSSIEYPANGAADQKAQQNEQPNGRA